jgi:SulP family sulfate permease
LKSRLDRLWPEDLQPKLIAVLREGLTREIVTRDVLAGIVVGIVALPLAIAFAIASGVRPEQGLYTAVVAGLLISVLSGSRVQIGGPTGAFVVLVLSIVQEFGYDGLAVATLMAGALLIAMGWARLGAVIRFIPYPVTVGFTTGIALVIAVGQIPEALGLQLAGVEADFLPRLRAFAEARATLDWAAAGLTVLTAGTVLLWPRVTHLVPGPLVALLVATGLTHLLGLGVETVGTRYGGVPSALPSFRLPSVDRAVLPDLFQPALAIALLAGIESLLSAVVADGMTGRRHRANAELVAQGVANLVAPLFGGIPATGAIARTATNVKNGGRTPVAGIVHALTLLARGTSSCSSSASPLASPTPSAPRPSPRCGWTPPTCTRRNTAPGTRSPTTRPGSASPRRSGCSRCTFSTRISGPPPCSSRSSSTSATPTRPTAQPNSASRSVTA